MSLKDRYTIERISYREAMEVVVKNHYLHRKCPCSFAFGLFEDSDIQRDLFSFRRLVGVVVFGTPSSSTLREGICGIEEKNNVIELNRLWVEDGTPKNTESYFISKTLKKVDKQIIVSYADSSANHIGIVYQATNFIYTGLSAKRTDWTIEGMDNAHSQTLADKYTSKEIRDKFGDRFKLVDRPRKHRYIYFNCSKTRKKGLLYKLKYPILPYPKTLAQ